MATDITMSFKILFVTATSSEADVLRKISGMVTLPEGFRFGNFDISIPGHRCGINFNSMGIETMDFNEWET